MMCTAGTEHIEAREFQEWLAAAHPGDRIAYAKGALAASIHTALQAEHPHAQKLSALQEATWRAGAQMRSCGCKLGTRRPQRRPGFPNAPRGKRL